MIRYVVRDKNWEKLRHKEVGIMPIPRKEDEVYLHETNDKAPILCVVTHVTHYPLAWYIVVSVIEK